MNVEVVPFLSMNGQAAEAIAFYEKHLGAMVLFKKNYKEMKEMDPQFSYKEGQDDYITHSVLEIGSNKIMIAEEEIDTTRPWQLGNSSSLCIQSKEYEVIEAIYHNLKEQEHVIVLSRLEKILSAQATP
ncbi:PhnB protein [Bacillus horti]|uniref:PhnB protein n=1 Tax=Caldalkalibacillus horti TaxID=77523 RepID=A0ABT9VYA0_9BACI|nr:PhnB protein [Bacillus horti]